MGQATRFRLGSVPDWVAHDAPCDLLIVDTTGRAGPREPAPPYMRILAGTDGSGTATEAVRKAYTLASVYAGTVTLVHVGDPLVELIKLAEVEPRNRRTWRSRSEPSRAIPRRCSATWPSRRTSSSWSSATRGCQASVGSWVPFPTRSRTRFLRTS